MITYTAKSFRPSTMHWTRLLWNERNGKMVSFVCMAFNMSLLITIVESNDCLMENSAEREREREGGKNTGLAVVAQTFSSRSMKRIKQLQFIFGWKFIRKVKYVFIIRPKEHVNIWSQSWFKTDSFRIHIFYEATAEFKWTLVWLFE